tara:strand:+ start:2033 stop:4387 length:2355 start_codon:yes stop_codon:yes gene_type:complete
MRVSYFKNVVSTTPLVNSKCVLKVLDSVKNGEYKTQVANVRVEVDKTKRNQLKAKLPLVTFGGTFTTRGNSNLKKHSGLICLDFDDIIDLDQLRESINSDEFTFSSFVSPSGKGLKVLVKIPLVNNNDNYQDYYIEAQNHFNKYAITDDAPKAIGSCCYLSYDEHLYLNSDSKLFTDKFNRPLPVQKEIPNIPLTDQDAIADKLEVWFKKRWSNVNRNTNLHAYARQMNAFGVSMTICENYLLRYDVGGKEKEILSLIKSAYKYTSEHNTQSFEDTEKVRDLKNLVLSGQTKEVIKNKILEVDSDNLELEIQKHKQELKHDEFWYYTDKDVIKLATFRFLNYLEHNNISKYYPDVNSDTYLFIKKDKNFVSLFGDSKIKDFTLTDLRNRGLIDAFELMANNNNSFNPRYLSMINTVDIDLNKDDKDTSYLYYKNKAVKTTKDTIELIDYKDVKGFVWKNQIIDRDIVLNDKSDGEFKTFIWKLSGEDKERYYTLKSVIGYLMHSFQSESKPKSIIFNDQMMSDDIPNGGSGKGLIHKAIGHIKNIVIEDGKKFDSKNQFAYQKINSDTQILLLDDVPKHFNFENLFSIITEGITVEKKGKDAFQIPFEESPKISITTNYTVNGSGASFSRRVFEVEICNFFNENYTPEMEFGHQFFSDWDNEEWQKFDNYMARNVQFFLKNGLVESNKVNLALRKLKNNLGVEFIEFMEAKDFNGSPLIKKSFRNSFDKEYPNLAKFNSPQKFNSKVKQYCTFFKLELNEKKTNGQMAFYIGQPKTIENSDLNF